MVCLFLCGTQGVCVMLYYFSERVWWVLADVVDEVLSRVSIVCVQCDPKFLLVVLLHLVLISM